MSDAETDRRLLMGLLAVHDAPCPRCGYGLKGLTEARCPECGGELILREVMRGRPDLPRSLARGFGGVAGWVRRIMLGLAALWTVGLLLKSLLDAAMPQAGGREALACLVPAAALASVLAACLAPAWVIHGAWRNAAAAMKLVFWLTALAMGLVAAATVAALT